MGNELSDLIQDVREQVLYLQELGVETLDAKLPEANAADIVESVPTIASVAAKPLVKETEIPKLEVPPKPLRSSAGSRLTSLPSLSRRASAAAPRSGTSASQEPVVPAESASTPSENIFGGISELPESDETMEQVWADIGNCTRCPLHEGRTQIVQTVGNYTSDLMFVGEAPGADEDAKGEPFVGRAGQLLNKIIEAIGMKREEVCIGNINRCRPPGNRQPTLPEAHTCKPFLLREIAVIRPKVIVVMGNTALHNLLDTKVGITRMRGQFHDYFGVKVMPTFHPAYLLRDPSKKREVWDDMKKVRDYLNTLG
jgi:uracil-DNA glycosylase